MTAWRQTVDLYDLFHDDDLPFEEARDQTCGRLAGVIPEDLLDELKYSDTADEFNDTMDRVFDWADYNRVWINVAFPVPSGSNFN